MILRVLVILGEEGILLQIILFRVGLGVCLEVFGLNLENLMLNLVMVLVVPEPGVLMRVFYLVGILFLHIVILVLVLISNLILLLSSSLLFKCFDLLLLFDLFICRHDLTVIVLKTILSWFLIG